NAFDLLFWALGAYLILRILQEDRPQLWPAFGVVAGLGLLNKYSMLFFGFGLAVGLLLTRQRRQMLRTGLWIGGLAAAVLVLPHLAWEWTHGWPSLEFMRNASQEKNVTLSVGEFFTGQILQVGFGQAVFWLAGWAWFAWHPAARRLRPLAWMYPVVFAVMVFNGAKAYYLTPIYPPYLAAGAVWLEALTARRWLPRLRPVLAAALTVLSLVVLPFAIPCLPVDTFIAYSMSLGWAPRAEEHSALDDLPQYYADQFGWEELTDQVAGIYEGLSPAEREHCAIYVRNYGEAAAIDFFGRGRGLPPALSAHNSYYFWGPGDTEMRAAIILGGSSSLEENLADLEGPDRCGEVELAGVTDCRHCMPFERDRQLFVCRDPHFTFAEIWEGERFFY
ncbi:MAG: glycosyltransferase family 39 protein, partial [Acidobacteriota bacterium]